ncbi:hypothetical protein GPK70_03815 [Fusicatenibacter saccharivorans]|uniref:acyltransferase family protein n=1 Tax=Fusicatenibacter saccharivorans TaxID=1150298 RepID=UPI001C0162A1|nr:acyltransferase family protein [Fusicatenibacter saccharivorans]MBT9686789.1 hypothetical protein [Fusicatenibacter saccharivorans]
MNKKKIDYRFKILYAVAILMVVAGHCDGGGISLDFAQWFPYEGIHLALFTFCSGYFFKDAALKRPGRYVCKKLRTLILPMYGYTIAYGRQFFGDYGISHQLVADSGQNSVFCSVLCNGYFL